MGRVGSKVNRHVVDGRLVRPLWVAVTCHSNSASTPPEPAR
jgi:hypothetical protein